MGTTILSDTLKFVAGKACKSETRFEEFPCWWSSKRLPLYFGGWTRATCLFGSFNRGKVSIRGRRLLVSLWVSSRE